MVIWFGGHAVRGFQWRNVEYSMRSLNHSDYLIIWISLHRIGHKISTKLKWWIWVNIINSMSLIYWRHGVRNTSNNQNWYASRIGLIQLDCDNYLGLALFHQKSLCVQDWTNRDFLYPVCQFYSIRLCEFAWPHIISTKVFLCSGLKYQSF